MPFLIKRYAPQPPSPPNKRLKKGKENFTFLQQTVSVILPGNSMPS